MSQFYLDPYAKRIGDLCGMSMQNEGEAKLLRLYALIGVCCEGSVGRSDVHDAWAVWRHETDPAHRSLVPFEHLGEEVQGLDQPYVDAINQAYEGVPND